MARSSERSLRADVDPDHAGRHRPARLTRVGPDAGEGVDGAGDRAEVDDEMAHGGGDGGSDSDEDGGARDGRSSGAEGLGDPPTPVVPLFSVPDSLRSVDVAVGGRAVRGLLLVAVVLLLTLGGRWWWVNQQAAGVPVDQVVDVVGEGSPDAPQAEDGESQEGPQGVEVPEAGESPHALPTSLGGGTGAAPNPSDAGVPSAETVLVVHVIGQVHEPGVVELPLGSRVIDAVRAAGGVTDEADPASLNLARPVADGEQVWVGAPGEEPPPGLLAGPDGAGGVAGAGGAAGSPGADQAGADGGQGGPGLVVDLNLAGQAQLEELPGVGPVTAGNILAWREQHGRFTVVEELMEVSGIGEKTFEQLRPHVTVGG